MPSRPERGSPSGQLADGAGVGEAGVGELVPADADGVGDPVLALGDGAGDDVVGAGLVGVGLLVGDLAGALAGDGDVVARAVAAETGSVKSAGELGRNVEIGSVGAGLCCTVGAGAVIGLAGVAGLG